jgi:hypothetical protein
MSRAKNPRICQRTRPNIIPIRTARAWKSHRLVLVFASSKASPELNFVLVSECAGLCSDSCVWDGKILIALHSNLLAAVYCVNGRCCGTYGIE